MAQCCGCEPKKPRYEATETTPLKAYCTGDSHEASVARPDPALTIVVCLCNGLLFGFMMVRSFVCAPSSIRGQFTFERWIMLKMFLSAAVASQLCLVMVSHLRPETFQRAREAACSSGGLFTAAIGGAILGVGMAIAGACPGMVLPQVGANIPWSFLTIGGGLTGTFAYSSVDAYLTPLKGGFQTSHETADELLGISYAKLALPMMLVCTFIVAMLEYLTPWNSAQESFVMSLPGSWLSAARWPPQVAGAAIGLLQLPFAMLLGKTLGSSSSYVTVCAQWLAFVPREERQSYRYLEAKRCGLWENLWQPLYLLSAAIGGYLAASTAEPSQLGPDVIPGVGPASAFVGGFLMLFGARLADGCTSGHGLSGMAFLSLKSFVAVPAMFLGGIVTAYITKAAGLETLRMGY